MSDIIRDIIAGGRTPTLTRMDDIACYTQIEQLAVPHSDTGKYLCDFCKNCHDNEVYACTDYKGDVSKVDVKVIDGVKCFYMKEKT